MKRPIVSMISMLAVLMAAVAINKWMAPTCDRIKITAHRGDQVEAPENTLPAFEAAIERQADFIELDVTQSKDGYPVVIHDDNLMRVAGVDKNVWELDYRELVQLDVGGYKSPEYEGTQIPLLQQALQLCKGKVSLNIELKYNGHESNDFVEKVLDLVKEEGMEEDCIITSFHYEFVKRVKELDASMKAGYIFAEEGQDLEAYREMDIFSVHYEILSEDMVSRIHKMGKDVHAWTVNDVGAMERCLALKIDNLITNDVLMARHVCIDRGKLD